MDRLFPCRLMIDPPQSGLRNMVVDECLLEKAAGEGIATLRFYQWSEPTLSLGYFQKYEDRKLHPDSTELPVVRRLSGGGTLLHDKELTYALCLPSNHPLVREPSQIYRLVHQAAIDALKQQDIPLLFWDYFAKANTQASPPDEPFLCFQRRTDDDLVITSQSSPIPMKVLGSAQRRRRGAVLQHGALLLSKSTYAKELPGLEEIAERPVDSAQVGRDWSRAIAEGLNLQFNKAETFRQTDDSMQTEIEKRLTSEDWLRRR